LFARVSKKRQDGARHPLWNHQSSNVPKTDKVGRSFDETELPKVNDITRTTPQQNEAGVTTHPEGDGTLSQLLQQMKNQLELETCSGRSPKPVQCLTEVTETETTTTTKADIEREILSFQVYPHDVIATQEGKGHPF
jgi:hypothetical protein